MLAISGGDGPSNARQQQVVNMLKAQQEQAPKAAQQQNSQLQMALQAPSGNSMNAWQSIPPNTPVPDAHDPVVPLGTNAQWDNFLANQGVTYLPQGGDPQVNAQAQMVSPQYADVGTSMNAAGQGNGLLQALLNQYLAQSYAQKPSDPFQAGNVAIGQGGPRAPWSPGMWGP